MLRSVSLLSSVRGTSAMRALTKRGVESAVFPTPFSPSSFLTKRFVSTSASSTSSSSLRGSSARFALGKACLFGAASAVVLGTTGLATAFADSSAPASGKASSVGFKVVASTDGSGRDKVYVEDIPLHKLQNPTSDLPKVVLVECGSFSPVTNLHLQLFEMNRDYLMKETKQFEVVGGIVSPVHDLYGKRSLVHQDHRVKMCELATADSNWIAVSPWETRQQSWSRTRLVLDHMKRALNASGVYKEPVAVKLMMGSDVLQSFLVPNLWSDEDIEVLLGEHGVVVTEREGADTAKLIENSMLRKFKDKIHICPQTVTNNISSTVVRSQLQKGQSAKYLLPDPVIEYIYANKLYNSVQGYFDSPRVLRSAM